MASTRYSRTAILLHWLVALLIVCAFVIGIWMTNIALSPTRLKLFNWHKWIGMCVLLLSTARLLWRHFAPPPPMPAMPRWQVVAASVGHGLLYALCLGVPLFGWLYSSSAGFPVVVFGVIPLPDLVLADRDLAHFFKACHRIGTYVMAGMVVLYVAAVLEHQFLRQDDLLARIGLQNLWKRQS